MNGKPGESAALATMATRSIEFGSAASQEREADAIDRGEVRTPSATAATLASCEPVTMIARKKGAPRATGAIVARNKFMPVLLS